MNPEKESYTAFLSGDQPGCNAKRVGHLPVVLAKDEACNDGREMMERLA